MSKKQRTGESLAISGLSASPVVHDGAIVHGYLGQARASSSATAERGNGEASARVAPSSVEVELRAEVERLKVEVARLRARVAGFRARRRR